jgi:adenylate cyclase class 2
MANETEVKILNIDTKQLMKRFDALGAKKKQETKLSVSWFRLSGTNEGEDKWFLRIRSNFQGKHEVTWKGKSTIFDKARQHEEINFFIQEPKKLSELFEKIGLEKYAFQEKNRTSFEYLDWKFDIDQYPDMPEFLEIEGNSEEHIKEAIKLLHMENNKTWADGERTLIQDVYNLDWYNMKFK